MAVADNIEETRRNAERWAVSCTTRETQMTLGLRTLDLGDTLRGPVAAPKISWKGKEFLRCEVVGEWSLEISAGVRLPLFVECDVERINVHSFRHGARKIKLLLGDKKVKVASAKDVVAAYEKHYKK